MQGQDADAPGLLLEAHMDTVQTKHMTINPFAGNIRNGKLYGRGACDTKGSLAAMMLAMEWFAVRNITPPIPIYMAATIDEEVNYLGILDIVKSDYTFAAAIVGEPTDLEIVVAHKGCMRCEIEVTGVAAHSSNPEEGVNAINKIIPVLLQIGGPVFEQLKKKAHPLVGSPTICVTEIVGGVAHNTIPDSCRIIIDRRTIPGEDGHQVWQDIVDHMRLLEEGEPSLTIKVHPPFLEDYAMETPSDSQIVRLLSEQVTNRLNHANVVGVSYGTNASKLAKAGIDSVVFGPGSIAQAHTKDEWIELEDVVKAAEILINTILNYE
ncbi:MAG: M20/M25/M40 family metallo-hydrolase [Lysinibacillus sp.]